MGVAVRITLSGTAPASQASLIAPALLFMFQMPSGQPEARANSRYVRLKCERRHGRPVRSSMTRGRRQRHLGEPFRVVAEVMLGDLVAVRFWHWPGHHGCAILEHQGWRSPARAHPNRDGSQPMISKLSRRLVLHLVGSAGPNFNVGAGVVERQQRANDRAQGSSRSQAA
ncbi:hypothetical protein B2G69_05480 [Methylorubrum zatmanii]|nr:hypothetical protein B2G69_05480 [Methylorubrum zatmanii]KQP99743.1 hypothetical protein ASF59_10080 [Methylobacterium sp. Leaf121]